MQLFTRLKTLVGSTLLAASLLLGATVAPASAQVAVYVSPVPVYTSGPGCPVAGYDLQNVLSGMYGVDAFRRPVNEAGFPVDVYGNCLTPAPVGEIFNYEPSGIYVGFLWSHYHYRYYYNPGFVRLYSGPGVIINRNYGAIPAGHTQVIIQNNYHAPLQTVRPLGNTTTVAPGVSTTVRPGAQANVPPAATVRPGASAPPAAFPSAGVTPQRAAPTTTFNRPTGAAPTSVAPQHSVTPPRSAAPTSTFVRPRH
jgi:hypothetical protein